MFFENTIHENMLLFSLIYLYMHQIVLNRNVPCFLTKIYDLISRNPFQLTSH